MIKRIRLVFFLLAVMIGAIHAGQNDRMTEIEVDISTVFADEMGVG